MLLFFLCVVQFINNKRDFFGIYLFICRPAKVDQVKFDVMELHARPELAAQQHMVDDGSGEVKVRKPKK